MLSNLPLVVLATTLSLRALAAPSCFPETELTPEKRAASLELGYGAGVHHYCKRMAEALPAPESEAVVELDITQTADAINVSSTYLACYVIYSTARVKRALPGLTERDIEKRCGKSMPKRSADPEPEAAAAALFNVFPDPDGGAGGGGAGGFDGGTWPGDVGDGFLQCYTVHYSDKRDVSAEGLEKRCGKVKREAEDMVIARDKPKYANYDRYVPV